MTPSARCPHKCGALGSTQLLPGHLPGRILADGIMLLGNAERAGPVASEQPCTSVYVNGDKVAAGARSMDGGDPYVGQRTEDMRLQQIRMVVAASRLVFPAQSWPDSQG
jgi:hypothetical protein